MKPESMAAALLQLTTVPHADRMRISLSACSRCGGGSSDDSSAVDTLMAVTRFAERCMSSTAACTSASDNVDGSNAV
eukprot:6111654-Prymnesium_polylepis.1